ncbi:hypothetical protein [Pseudomonas kitaguniensis]|uniref:hypothetical protein n=1 Tax=Pseudomonas kitaguniensis TaxID=2607908 RepID=UPI003D01570D
MPIKPVFISKLTIPPPPTPAIKAKPASTSSHAAPPTALKKDPSGQYHNKEGKLVNKHHQLINDKGKKVNDAGQLINKKGQPINDKGHLINAHNQTINSQGKAVNDAGHLIDAQGRTVNTFGRVIDDKGHYIDNDKKLVNKEGFLVDNIGRALDKDGKLARDQASAVKGNNEPHPDLLPPALTKQVYSWQGKVQPPASPPKATVAEVAVRLSDAEKLFKSGVISPSASASLIARDAGISAGVTGLVSAPINVAAYSGSVAVGEAIKASYLPAPLVPPTPIAKSTVELPAAAPEDPASDVKEAEEAAAQALYPRIDDAQIVGLTVTNLSIALRYGETGENFIPGPHWPSVPLERMEQLESMLDFAEEHTKTLADDNQVYFKCFIPKQKAADGLAGLGARLDALEGRLAALNRAQGLVIDKLSAGQPVELT